VLHVVGTPGEYVEGFDEKGFSFWSFVVIVCRTKPIPPPFCKTTKPGKWSLHEEYGGPNLGENEFHFFQDL